MNAQKLFVVVIVSAAYHCCLSFHVCDRHLFLGSVVNGSAVNFITVNSQRGEDFPKCGELWYG